MILLLRLLLADTLFASAVDQLVKSEPQLVFGRSKFLRGAMKQSRVTEDEVKSAIRQQGFGALELVDAVVLETNGKLSASAVPQARPQTN